MSGQKKILAVASSGGHWVQLLRLRPAFENERVTFVSTRPACQTQVQRHRFRLVHDANRWSKLGLVTLAVRVLWIVLRERPHVVLSTGAAPGYFALLFGKLLGARTIWIDSIANVEQLSLSGEQVGKFADLWLTQWPHLAREEGPHFVGAVL